MKEDILDRGNKIGTNRQNITSMGPEGSVAQLGHTEAVYEKVQEGEVEEAEQGTM